MAKFSLQTALDLAERRAEAKSRVVRVAYAAWLNARTHLVRLEQRRQHYAGALNAKMRGGCSASLAQAANSALCQWRQDMRDATQALERAHRERQLALEDWEVERQRLHALQMLARRHALERRKLEEKHERRLHDELSARGAHALRFGQDGHVALLQPQAGRE